jgi:hypothetical protein
MAERPSQAERIREAVAVIREVAKEVEMGDLFSSEAPELLDAFSTGERVCAAGRMLTARVVERSGTWRRDGHRSAAHWISSTTGVSVGAAVGTLETARRLEHLPRTTEAFTSGEISEVRVREVAAAGVVAPHGLSPNCSGPPAPSRSPP